MDHDQERRHAALHNRDNGYKLLTVAVIAGLFSVVMFPDWGWSWSALAMLICLVTAWAAFVLMIDASRVIAHFKSKQRTVETENRWTDLEETDDSDSLESIDIKPESPSVAIASILGWLAMLSIAGLGIFGRMGQHENQNRVRIANQQQAPVEPLFSEYGLSEVEREIMTDAMFRGAKIRVNKVTKHIVALDYSSTQRVNDELLEKYSHDLPSLSEFDLRFTPVTDSGVQHLATLQTLRRLRLGGTEVTPEMISTLQFALPECVIDTDIEDER